MKSIILKSVFVTVFVLSMQCLIASQKGEDWFINANKTASLQLIQLSTHLSDSAKFPRTLKKNKLYLVPTTDWTSGFFPGSLWYMYELTNDSYFRKQAEKYTELLDCEKKNSMTHDIGFMMYCSYGNGLRLTNDVAKAKVLVESANSLFTRYSPITKTIRSWDSTEFPQFHYPVIIDNMMNLELLFWASDYTKDQKYKNIALSHANTTMKNHFRPDMSTYHVVDYHPINGDVIQRKTFQGYADNSSWARGQAWGLYGYTVCYRFTKDKRYLIHADKIAKYILNSVKTDDLIPYWDYNAPNIPNAPRDASAAAVTASALLELSKYSKNGKMYFNYAKRIIMNLSSDKYLSIVGENNGFVLKHSVGSFPHNSEVDVPLNYADYYYLEALKRYKDLTVSKNK